MLAICNTLVINGIDAVPVKVEVDIQTGLPAFEIVGLASLSIKEARERVKSAIKNSGFIFPNRKIIVNLAPADLKKEGTHFDLAIAIGILIASGQIINRRRCNYFLAGELSLDGTVRGVPGILAMVLELSSHPQEEFLIIPEDNASEAALVPEVETIYTEKLYQLANFIDGKDELANVNTKNREIDVKDEKRPDLAEVKGQESAKRALQVAAAGLHNLLLIGPPGGGKTMLARRIGSILPDMTREEILETTRIYSVANLLDKKCPLIMERPFRAPFKNASATSIAGGGRIPRPGEISLAQNGILFLDELPEFSRDVLESLRQPMEDKIITISRTQATYTYPANFTLIASMNPCPCGNFGSENECRCTPLQIQKYLNKISGPLLDRMDLHVEVPRVNYQDLHNDKPEKTSAEIKATVEKARLIQQERFQNTSLSFNSQMQAAQLKEFCQLGKDSSAMLKKAFEHQNLSARAYTRILKVARTIADLEAANKIELPHIAEALQYRSLDRKYWNN